MIYDVVDGNRTMKRSWGEAYKRFLMSKDESLLLKIAPVLLIVGAPEAVVATLVPVVGELIDIGTIWLVVIVALRTIAAVRKYRAAPSP